MQKVWLFQAKPEWYRLDIEVPSHQREGVDWSPKHQCDEMKAGHHVVLWQSGSEAGVYAFGRMKSDARKTSHGWRVDIAYEPLLRQPVFKKDLRKHPVLRNLAVLKMPRGTSYPVTANEWRALNAVIRRDSLNIFRHYKQQEDQFTNGLVSLLEASTHESPKFVHSFLNKLLGIEAVGHIRSFRVLRDIEGTADAEICGSDCCIRFETKIESDSLRPEQVQNHLQWLARTPESRKTLVLLTPDGDNSYIERFLNSKWIKRFRAASRHHKVMHLQWTEVYKYLKAFVKHHDRTVFSNLVDQFLRQIHDQIYEQDYAGVIQKIAFGDESGVYAKTTSEYTSYLDWIKKGEWGDTWHTPEIYKKLDGTGRKLMLYDKTRKAITVEVEIAEVKPTKRASFSCANIFAPGTLKIYDKPIPLDRIAGIVGFENFASGRAPAWNVTREQYLRLLGTHEV